ncbi:MAG: DUF4350 domain-containing protein [Gammaproteobacteria bacterium]|nr:DUF4350 domain-containing protein [Gammaproteobacteria bacterium]
MRQSTIVLLLLLAGVLYASWFFTNHDKVTRTQYVGYSGEARFNEFYAAENLLVELGLEADSRSDLTPSEWLPPYEDTIVVHAAEPLAVGEDLSQLLSWVSGGGHLVLLPPRRESEFADNLLEYFGFFLEEVEVDEYDELDDESEDDADDDEADEKEFDYLIALSSTFYRINAYDEDALSATLSDEKGNVLARRSWEEGFVTVVASRWYFSNNYLSDSDHARLLLDTVAGYVTPGKTWFIYNSAFPSLWEIIWTTAPYVVLGFATCLLLWLWSKAPTFGPAEGPESLARRSILEHVRAAGNFAWRNHSAAELVASSTAAIMHEAEFRHPGISRLALNAQARQIAKMTGLTVESVFDALNNQDHTRHREFTRLMKTLQRIRKNL